LIKRHLKHSTNGISAENVQSSNIVKFEFDHTSNFVKLLKTHKLIVRWYTGNTRACEL